MPVLNHFYRRNSLLHVRVIRLLLAESQLNFAEREKIEGMNTIIGENVENSEGLMSLGKVIHY